MNALTGSLITPHAQASAPSPVAPHGQRSATSRLGDEPALGIVGGAHPARDQHQVSLRWLSASLLVAVSGAALLGGAVYVALDGETNFAELPTLAETDRPALGPAQGRKGDRLVEERTLPALRQSVRAPYAQRVGDREVIRVRPFIRLATALSQTSGVYATDIPPFNPLSLFAEGGPTTERQAEIPVEVPDAEVSIVKQDIAGVSFGETPLTLSDAEIIAQIEEERANTGARARRAPLPIPPQLMLGRTLRAPVDFSPPAPNAAITAYAPIPPAGFSNIEVRVIPENVTEWPKTRLTSDAEKPLAEQFVLIRRGETFEGVLAQAGATPDQVRGIVAALGGRARVTGLPEGQVLQITTAAGAAPTQPRPVVRVAILNEGREVSRVAVDDAGRFVPVQIAEEAPPAPRTELARRRRGRDDGEGSGGGTGARLYDSLYETALRHEVPRALVEDMVRVFAHDLDFQRRVGAGDSLEMVFTDQEDPESGRTELLYAALSVGGETRRIFRFQAPDDGFIDYFDDEGRSLKKFLLRKPVVGDIEMRSGFGMRFHPILRYSKMHTGIDWANGRVGTPIIAAGNGTVIKAGWDSGYGRRVEIQHANGYVTTYSHMNSFGRGIEVGARVRQGQVIGTVGSSGLSTGPHLHYEVMVNGNFVNPMRIRLPRGRELDGPMLAEFRRQRDQIDEINSRGGGVRLAEQRLAN